MTISAQRLKDKRGIIVDTSSIRRFLESMPDEQLMFYEDSTFPLNRESKLA